MSSAPELPPEALRRLLDAAAQPEAPETPETPGAGARLGRYRLLRELGRGGMGVVYEAVDEELGRRVALKRLAHGALADAAARERFVREARAAARLSHPGIAAVYDATEEWIALQFVDGLPLSAAPRDDLRRSVTSVRDAALAVQHAHEHGIVHRDLKPSNLLRAGERTLVTDFGLAKDSAVAGELSHSGQLLGTPAYMAPEQALGRAREVDARSDVYGLGATLYDLLAGRPPFVERDFVRLVRAVAEEDPPALSVLRPELPRDLARVVHKCLAKERERRYASARELAEDLTRWLAGLPVRADAPGLGYRLAKFARRRRALVGVGGVSALVLCAVALVWWNERSTRRASEAALALADRLASVADESAELRRNGEVEAADERLDRAIADCQAFVAAHEVAEGHALLGELLRARHRGEEARAALERALALQPGLARARRERGLAAAEELGARLVRRTPPAGLDEQQGLSSEERQLREQALGDLRATAGAAGRRAGLVRAQLARLEGDRATARRELQELLRREPAHAEAMLALSELALAEGDADAAWMLAMSALDLTRGLGPAYEARSRAAQGVWSQPAGVDEVARRHQLTAADAEVRARGASTETLLERANARLALDDVQGALSDLEALLAADPSDATAHANRALVHTRRAAAAQRAGDAAAALEAWADAIAAYAVALELEPSLLGALNNLAVCHSERLRIFEERGELPAVERERALALAALDRALAAAPRFALAFANRGALHRLAAESAARAGDPAGCTAHLRAALDDLGQALGLRPDDAAMRCERALAQLGSCTEQTAAEARARARQDLEHAARVDPRAARPKALLARVLRESGEPAERWRPLLEEAARLAPAGPERSSFERELSGN